MVKMVDATGLIDWCERMQRDTSPDSDWHKVLEYTIERIGELSVEVPDAAAVINKIGGSTDGKDGCSNEDRTVVAQRGVHCRGVG